jgi:hypothetical protein
VQAALRPQRLVNDLGVGAPLRLHLLQVNEPAQPAGDIPRRQRIALKVLVTLGEAYGADRLVEIASAHVVGSSYQIAGEAGIDILFMSLADHLATRGPNLEMSHWRRHVNMVEYVLSQRYEQENLVHPPKLVDGDAKNALAATFGAHPSLKHAVVVDTDIDVYDPEW